MMRVSVILPARNAADTLQGTIASLQAQSMGEWEAVVVVNGSTDRTIETAEGIAARDARVRVVASDETGVAKARNRGLREARHDWVLFLDADDTIEPDYLEKMTGAIRRSPDADGAYCGFVRVTEEGERFDSSFYWDSEEELFETFCRTCAWGIHCVVVRRSLVLGLRGFPEDWVTCEDWLLWQRALRAGARFARVPEFLAIYRARPGSASMDARRMAEDMIRVVGVGHGPDPAVESPAERYRAGRDPSKAAAARLEALSWAALEIGHGGDGRFVLDLVPDDRDLSFWPGALAYSVLDGVLLPGGLPPLAWTRLWVEREKAIRELFEAYEAHTGASGLARRAMTMLERLILARVDGARPLTIGRSHSVAVEATDPIRDIRLPAGTTRLECDVHFHGERLGPLYLPVCGGTAPAAVVADAIASEFTWTLLEKAFRGGGLSGAMGHATRVGGRAIRGAGWFLRQRRGDFEEWAFTSMGWLALLHEILRRGGGSDGGAREMGGRPLVDLSLPIPDLAAGGDTVDVVVALGGSTIGLVRVGALRGRAKAAAIRRAALDSCGFELARIAVREGILGSSRESELSIGARLRRKAEARAARNDPAPHETAALARRRPFDIGAGASRFAMLPAESWTEPGIGDASGGAPPPCGRPILYDPGRIVPAGDTPPDPSDPPRAPSGRGRDTALRIAQRAIPGARAALGRRAITDRLPILMYHRIADDDDGGDGRYRVPPRAFEEQMRFLAGEGYETIDLERWREARSRRRQIRGRAVLLTFDDGFRDFRENAWPVLRARGFTATVFLVTGAVGSTNRWDEKAGGAAPLLDWDDVLALRDEGVRFGSHTATHSPLTALAPAEVVREAARSRHELARRLGRPVDAFAYPYGDFDPAVRHLIGACGYEYGLTCEAAHARYFDSLLELPRFEVTGDLTLDHFARMLPWRR